MAVVGRKKRYACVRMRVAHVLRALKATKPTATANDGLVGGGEGLAALLGLCRPCEVHAWGKAAEN